MLIEFILVFNKQSNHTTHVVFLFHPAHVASSGASISADCSLHFSYREERQAEAGGLMKSTRTFLNPISVLLCAKATCSSFDTGIAVSSE